MINKVNDVRVSRDSQVKYKFIFNRRCPRRHRRGFENSVMPLKGRFQSNVRDYQNTVS